MEATLVRKFKGISEKSILSVTKEDIGKRVIVFIPFAGEFVKVRFGQNEGWLPKACIELESNLECKEILDIKEAEKILENAPGNSVLVSFLNFQGKLNFIVTIKNTSNKFTHTKIQRRKGGEYFYAFSSWFISINELVRDRFIPTEDSFPQFRPKKNNVSIISSREHFWENDEDFENMRKIPLDIIEEEVDDKKNTAEENDVENGNNEFMNIGKEEDVEKVEDIFEDFENIRKEEDVEVVEDIFEDCYSNEKVYKPRKATMKRPKVKEQKETIEVNEDCINVKKTAEHSETVISLDDSVTSIDDSPGNDNSSEPNPLEVQLCTTPAIDGQLGDNTITIREYASLTPKAFLVDTLLNFWVRWIHFQHQTLRDNGRQVMVISTEFARKLDMWDPVTDPDPSQELRNWTEHGHLWSDWVRVSKHVNSLTEGGASVSTLIFGVSLYLGL